MSIQYWLALAAMAFAPVAASAEQAHSQLAHPQPAHPQQPSREAAATGYQSAFADYKPFAEGEEAPETRWRAVNEAMGELGGHAAHMKGDDSASSASPAQARPAAEPPKADAPVDRSKHH